MIGFTPDLYKDELLAGGLARGLAVLKQTSSRQAVATLFSGQLKFCSALTLSGIRCLSPLYPGNVGAEVRALAELHTFLRYTAYFSSASQLERIYLSVEQPSKVPVTFGCGAKLFARPRFLRVCAECLASDAREGRQFYWRRVHQLPGVYLCPDHAIELDNSYYTTSGSRDVLPPSPDLVGIDRESTRRVPPSIRNNLLAIARDSKQILSTPSGSKDVGAIAFALRKVLVRIGYGWKRAPSLISMAALVSDLMSYPVLMFLMERSTIVAEQRLATTLNKLLRRTDAIKLPLGILLLLQFANCSLAEFEDLVASYRPQSSMLSSGPCETLPCVNPKCPRFHQSVGPTLLKRLPAGRHHIQCNHCALKYSWSSRSPGSVAVLTTGPIWDEALRARMIGDTASLRRLSIEFGVSVPALKRHALRLGVWNESWTMPQKTQRRIDRLYSLMRKHRETWKQQQEQHPTLNEKSLGAAAKSAYRYLLRHDRAWLSANSFTIQGKRKLSDWQCRESELITRIDAAREMAQRAGNHRRSRLRAPEVLQFAGLKHILWRHAEALPDLKRSIVSVDSSSSE